MNPFKNHLLDLLRRNDCSRLLAACEPIELVLAEVLNKPGEQTSYVYFPTEGFISLVAQIEGSPGVEVGMVGREAVLGAQFALGVVAAPLKALLQSAGRAKRIRKDAFAAQLPQSWPCGTK